MTNHLRTLGIVAHIDAGKTTLTERILFDAGVQRYCGEVDQGTATMDWMRQEQERGISIGAAVTRVPWNEQLLQIVDTPGHVDFTAEVERCMRVLDGVIVVLDSVRGVESQTETVWHKASDWRCARLVFVNKMDRVGADFPAALEALRQRFDCRPVAVVVPLYNDQGAFSGLGDPVLGSAMWFDGSVPTELQERFAEQLRTARDEIIEACADIDEAVMQAFVAGQGIATEQLLQALRRGCAEGELVPVLCGAALHDQGVDWLLDAVCDLLPSLLDRARGGLEDAFPVASAAASLSALVFKCEHVEEEVRSYVRVFEGVLRRGDRVMVGGGEEFVVDELWLMHASHHEMVDHALPGEIVVLPDLPQLQTGQTLHAPGAVRSLPMPRFSPPVVGALFEPATPLDEEPLLRALEELRGDDPTLRIERDVDSDLPLVLGMGELHLEVTAARVRERRSCAFSISPPRVALRATVARGAVGRAMARVPGVEEFTAEAAIRIAPAAPAAASSLLADPKATEVRVEASAVGGAAAIAADLQRRAASGVMLGSPAMAIAIEVLELRGVGGVAAGDGSDKCEQEGDEALLHQAVGLALQKAIEQAGIVVLEPLTEFELRCPAEHSSAVLADLAARGATMRQVSSGQMGALLQGRGRLKAFLGYATRLRSITRGRGEVQLQPLGYVPVA